MAKQCTARLKRNAAEPCGKVATTTRLIQAAPGLWIQTPLCYEHQVIWDQAKDFDGIRIFREPLNPEVLRRADEERLMSWDDMRHDYRDGPFGTPDRPYMDH